MCLLSSHLRGLPGERTKSLRRPGAQIIGQPRPGTKVAGTSIAGVAALNGGGGSRRSPYANRVASPGVPDVERSTRVRARLGELFERHRVVDPARVDRFYDSERGYYPPEEAGAERDHFAICLA